MRRTRNAVLLGLVGVVGLLWACTAEEVADTAAPGVASEDEASDPTAALVADPDEAGASDGFDYFLLEEFDWGDDPEVVEESLLFDPAFECHGTAYDRCNLVKVSVGDEELLARFDEHEGGLWQVVFLTPDLLPQQADKHLARVWNELIDYVTRWIGEPEKSGPLPDLQSLEIGPPQPTHEWRKKNLGVRVAVGRRDEDLFYVGAFFFDPAVEEEARPAWEAALLKQDAATRKRRAAKAERAAARAAKLAGNADEEAGPEPGDADDH